MTKMLWSVRVKHSDDSNEDSFEAESSGKRRRSIGRLCSAVLLQILVMQSTGTLPLSAMAQDSADSNEGSDSGSQCGPLDEDPDDEDQYDDDPGDNWDETDGTGSGDPTEQSESSPETPSQESSDGGDYGDGGGAPGDAGGTDGNGGDGGGGGGGGGGTTEDFSTVEDPIDLRLVDKRHVQVDYVSQGGAPVRVARVYHSNLATNPAQVTIPMGTGWRSYYDRTVQVISATQVRLHRANGRAVNFSYNGSAWTSSLPSGVLSQFNGGWQFVNQRDQTESYSSSGRLVSLTKAGKTTSLQYDGAGRLVGVANPFGRGVTFAYDGSGRMVSVTLPGGGMLTYNYDSANNLASTRFADNSVRQYAYENAAFPNALTGIVDESGRRRVTWGYDNVGRPNFGHYGNGVNRVNISYSGNQVVTTDSRGTIRTRAYGSIGGRAVLTNIQTSPTADTPATGWGFGYDSNGNLTSITTRTGEIRQITPDARGRPMSATRATGTALAMSAQTEWHPVFRKPVQATSRGITRNITIDGTGRVTAVSKTGTDGTVASTLQKVYNAQNLLQSITDARGATTTFSYDAIGNRTSVTNSAGQTTTFSNHNAHGQAGTIQRPDGTVVTRSFDLRARLVSRTIAGRTTTYSYDLSGRLGRVTRPDSSWRTHNYDAAGYLSGITNHRGESVSYGRDVDGRVVSRLVYAANGTVVRARYAQYNAVGRVAGVLDSGGNRTTIAYASDGRATGYVTPQGFSFSRQSDVLDRPIQFYQPNTSSMRQAGGAAVVSGSIAYHPVFGTQQTATDTGSVATGFSVDRFNRRVAESGADAGARSLVRSAAGDWTSSTDPQGTTFTITRDSLGRLTSIRPVGQISVALLYTYVPGQKDGLLASMTDTSGSTAWTYNTEGRVLTKRQTVASTTRTLAITRDTLGRTSSLTYPSGMRVDFTYSGDVVSAIAVNGATLLSNVTYQPNTKVATSWRWGNGSTYSRSYNTDGRISSVTLGSVTRSYTYDAVGRVGTTTDTGPQGTSSSNYSYDEAGQLASYSGPAGVQSFALDTSGNRRSDVINGAGKNYTYVAGSNRLSAVGSTRTYTYNSDGSVRSDRASRIFTYDVFGRMVGVNDKASVVSGYSGSYTYNGLNQRVARSAQIDRDFRPIPLARAQYFYDDSGRLLGDYDIGRNQETIWFNDLPVATVVQGAGFMYYVHADHLGTPRALTRSSDGAEVWRWDSDPFGTTAPTSTLFNMRFAGQYYDAETGLHYNMARYYDPAIGRYVQSDPIGLKGGLNRYAYVRGNPLSLTDPRGLDNPGMGPYGPAWDGCSGGGSGNDGPDYWDRYMNFTNEYAVNVGPYAAAVAGGLWPKSWAPATGFRPPALGSTNWLTSVPRAFGIPGADGALVRTGAAAIGVATVGIGIYNATIFAEGFLYAIPGGGGGGNCTCSK